jgi:hypothetical protein
MNEEFADLENELRSWTPLTPSRGLETRIAQALETAPTVARENAGGWLSWLGLSRPAGAFAWGLAAPSLAFLLLILLRGGSGLDTVPARIAPPAQAAEAFTPATASNELYQTSDEGVVYDSNRQPVRRVRYVSRDTLDWRDARSGATYEVSYPREDVVMTPINLQ